MTASYPDRNGVEFSAVRSILGPVRDWPKRGPLVRASDFVLEWKRETGAVCWFCGRRLEDSQVGRMAAHHIIGAHSRSDEATNLAQNPALAEDLILQMNSLLNRALDEEVGIDDGSFLPTGPQIPWDVDRWDL